MLLKMQRALMRLSLRRCSARSLHTVMKSMIWCSVLFVKPLLNLSFLITFCQIKLQKLLKELLNPVRYLLSWCQWVVYHLRRYEGRPIFHFPIIFGLEWNVKVYSGRHFWRMALIILPAWSETFFFPVFFALLRKKNWDDPMFVRMLSHWLVV